MSDDTKPTRIPLQDADLATLKHFAEAFLGIEIKPGTNAAQVRGMIGKAAPELKDVPPLPAPPAPIVQVAPAPIAQPVPQAVGEGEDPIARPAAVSLPASTELLHPSMDPKVTIMVAATADKSRPKDVTVGVNGDIFRIQRGQKVDVPYRVYLALEDAKEKAPVPDPSGATNPFTGEPIMVWEEVHSYPFSVYKEPSPEEVAAWHQRTGGGFGFKAAA